MKRARTLATALIVAAVSSCTPSAHKAPQEARPRASTTSTRSASPASAAGVYAHTSAANVTDVLRDDPPRVYVPNSEADTVDVIDPATFTVVDHFAVDRLPQHVTPAWDLGTLYVDNDEGNSLTPIDPRTGRPSQSIPVADPYNLYFSPDGSIAIVVAERLHRLDIRNPHDWTLLKSVPVPCAGIDHADFTGEGRVMIASCEFSGDLVRIDLTGAAVTGSVHVGGQPVDVRLSPDGSVFYVANQKRNGVSVIDAETLAERRFIPTGAGTHGLYPSRDARWLYVTNRSAGTISVLDFVTGQVHDTWTIGGSPDMGGVTADGTELWLSGRYDRAVYVIDTRTGRLAHTISVGAGPHGLCVWPQPGRHSLGHTGNMR